MFHRRYTISSTYKHSKLVTHENCLFPSVGCEYNGQIIEEGTQFEADDKCNTCTCTEGAVMCTEKACQGRFKDPCAVWVKFTYLSVCLVCWLVG